MINTVPPLWRDADAYVQLTQDPRVATFWGHAPAYCYIAKVPLFLGEQWDRMRGRPPVRRILETQPALTDSGIWMLIVAQHLGLALAVFLFITTVSHRFGIRLALVLLWASNALFYTFAHCLGSETLSLILIVLLATTAVRLVQRPAEPAWQHWYVFGVILLLCLLTRDINLGLVAFLPIAFLVSWAGSRNSKIRHDLRRALIAAVVGIACVLIAPSVPEQLARKTRLHPHSRVGFTFLWRLHFLNNLSPESRTALLQTIRQRTDSDGARHLVALLDQMQRESVDLLNPHPLLERGIAYFGGHLHWEDLDRGLNQMAFAFLWPPSPELLCAAHTDFVAGFNVPPTIISEYLFATTAYYFQHQDEMPGCAELVTFHGDANAERIRQIPFQHSYFQLWQPVSYLAAFLFWCSALIAYAIAAKWKGAMAGPTVGLASGLAAVGLLLFAASCLLHDFEPRFALPMWELLLLSLFVLLAKTTELFLAAKEGKVRRAAVRPEP